LKGERSFVLVLLRGVKTKDMQGVEILANSAGRPDNPGIGLSQRL